MDNSDYIWASLFKSGVVGYEKETHRYFMIYLPENRYDWVRRLAVREPWVYMSSDCLPQISVPKYQVRDEHCKWTLRFNKRTHEVQQGEFDTVINQVTEIPAKPDIGRLFSGNRQPEIIKQIRFHLRLRPGDPNLHNTLGGALLMYGNLDEAIAEFHTAILLDPTYAEPHMSLGNALVQKGLNEEGRRELTIGMDLCLTARRRY